MNELLHYTHTPMYVSCYTTTMEDYIYPNSIQYSPSESSSARMLTPRTSVLVLKYLTLGTKISNLDIISRVLAGRIKLGEDVHAVELGAAAEAIEHWALDTNIHGRGASVVRHPRDLRFNSIF